MKPLACFSLALLCLTAPDLGAEDRFFGIDFNCDSSLAEPSQGGFRILRGPRGGTAGNELAVQAQGVQVTVRTGGTKSFDFRGSNHDADRALPGGDTELSALVADHINTREGQIILTLDTLPAGDYRFRSYHLDTFTGLFLSFAQGSSPTSRQNIQARWMGSIQDEVLANALGSSGLRTTVIANDDIPVIDFTFTSDGLSPTVIELVAEFSSSGGDRFLLLNGFEILSLP